MNIKIIAMVCSITLITCLTASNLDPVQADSSISLKVKKTNSTSYLKNNKSNADIKQQLALHKMAVDREKATNQKIKASIDESRKSIASNTKPITIKESYDFQASYYDKAKQQQKEETLKFEKLKNKKAELATKLQKEYEKFLKQNPSGKKSLNLGKPQK